MDTQKVKLSQVTENVENPRTITDRNLQKLITSILVFPKMLALRPIVVDDTMTALGGNMRLRALSAISTFTPEQIANRLQGCTDYEKKTPAEREALINYWRAWLEEPTTEVANDKTLTEDEKRAFIIKDNVAYGEWNEDALTDGWDAQQLEEWNINTWEESQGLISPDEFGDDFTLPDDEKGNLETVSFILSNEQAEFVKAKLELVEVCDTYDNTNKKGNAIYEIVRQWDAARK